MAAEHKEQDSKVDPVWENIDSRFVWNQHLVGKFLNFSKVNGRSLCVDICSRLATGFLQ